MLTNVSLPLSSFVGREDDLAWVGAQLDDQRLLTLTGSGGCGKTRLALQAASAAVERFPDGAWCADLAPVGSPDQVAAVVGRVLGLREELGRPLLDTLAEELHDFDGLLVVDNCEHVLDGARSTVEHLLTHCPGLRVLATSREPLGLVGEATWRVPSLDAAVAVELFVQRARAVRPGFAPDAAEARTITDVVARLDGIPLAIELAAARVRMMSPTAIAAALHDRFRLLTGGSATGLARQRTLEASVAWSYDHLDERERLLARRLSVMNGFTLEAAEEVAADELLDRYEVLDLLGRLVDTSMVGVDPVGAETRYRFLESVRQYLQDRLVESGEAEDCRVRHLTYFLSLAERIEPAIAFRDSAALLDRLEGVHDDLDAALEFADTSGRREHALRLATSLALFWELTGHFDRASRWFRRLLEQEDAEPTRFRGRACWGAAHVALYGGDIETMAARAPEALEQAESFDDDWTRARALNAIGFATAITTPDQAGPGLARSIELGLGIGDPWSVMNSRKMVTVAAWAAQDDEAAAAALKVLHRHAREHESAYFLAWFHGLTGSFHAHRGELGEAREHLEAAVALADGVGEPVTGGLSRAWLRAVDVTEGQYERAEEECLAQLRRARASGGAMAIPDLLASLGWIEIARGEPKAALALLAPAHEAHREHGIPFMVAVPALVLASAHRRVGDTRAASSLLDELATLSEGSGNPWVRARVDLERGRVALDGDDWERAEQLAHAALGVLARMQRRPDVLSVLDVLGSVAAAAGSEAEALRCFGAAAAGRARSGIVALPPDAAAVEQRCETLRASLGAEEADAAWAQGEELDLDEAVAYVSRARGERRRPDHGWSSLTPTELRVVELVAEGLTNPQVAERMFIARGTVKVHVSHIFAKLGLANRAELAAQAARRSALADDPRA